MNLSFLVVLRRTILLIIICFFFFRISASDLVALENSLELSSSRNEFSLEEDVKFVLDRQSYIRGDPKGEKALLTDEVNLKTNRSERVLNPFNLFDIRGNPPCLHQGLDGLCMGLGRCAALGGLIGLPCRRLTGICCRFVRGCGQRSSQEIVHWRNYDEELRSERASFIDDPRTRTQRLSTDDDEKSMIELKSRNNFALPASNCDILIVRRTKHYCGLRIEPSIKKSPTLKNTEKSTEKSDVCAQTTRLSVLGLGERQEISFCPFSKSINLKRFDYNISDVDDIRLTLPSVSSSARSEPLIDVKITQLKCIEFSGEDLEEGAGITIEKPKTTTESPKETTTTDSVTVAPKPDNFAQCTRKARAENTEETNGTESTQEHRGLENGRSHVLDLLNGRAGAREIIWGVPSSNSSNFFYVLRKNPPVVFSTRITNGLSAYDGEFPWQAALFTGGNTYTCGASIIGDYHILTAAHCVDQLKNRPKSVKFRIGSHVLSNVVQEVLAEKIHVHESYSSTSLQNDIAVIKVATRITFTETIKPVCLPGPRELTGLEGKKATVSGWGRDGSDKIQTVLQKLTSKVMSNAECAQRWGAIANVGPGMICLDAESGDSCKGDSGGPLVVEVKTDDGERYFQVGLVSFGSGSCSNPRLPGVYTRMTHYLDWIRRKMTN